MKCIDSLSEKDLKGKRVLLRTSLDLPLNKQGEASDEFRLKRSFPTIEFLLKAMARVILICKIGRDPADSTAPVAVAMKKYLPVFFVPDLTGKVAHGAAAAMKDGDLVMLENTQQDPREIAGDDTFARELASLADLYVNDAFLSTHRTSTTMVNVAKFLPSYAGLLMRDEVQNISSARNPQSPSFAILGGAKFETKAPFIKILLERYDHLFITGALANDVFKAQGYETGVSLISKELPTPEILNHPHFVAPIDVTVERPDKQARVKKPNEVLPDEKIVDIGPDSIAHIAPFITQSKYILWNGPTGIYEAGYVSYTHAIADLVGKAVDGGAMCVIGGGDTIAAIQESGVSEARLGFLSTGGGAMLEYLLKGTLPGIEALK